jgi:CheY-like chemotaxis protein
MRILVLDDEPARHALFRQVFRGHEVAEATTAEHAVNFLRIAVTYDIVSLDHDLGPSPGSGLDVARRIAGMPENIRPRQVLVHSANPVGAQAMLDTLLRAGVNAQRVDPLKMAGVR